MATFDDHLAAYRLGQREPATPASEDWMRPQGATQAVIVQSATWADVHREALLSAFPGRHIVVVGDTIPGFAFKRIFVLCRLDRERDRRWLQDVVMPHMMPGGKLLWLA